MTLWRAAPVGTWKHALSFVRRINLTSPIPAVVTSFKIFTFTVSLRVDLAIRVAHPVFFPPRDDLHSNKL